MRSIIACLLLIMVGCTTVKEMPYTPIKKNPCQPENSVSHIVSEEEQDDYWRGMDMNAVLKEASKKTREKYADEIKRLMLTQDEMDRLMPKLTY